MNGCQHMKKSFTNYPIVAEKQDICVKCGKEIKDFIYKIKGKKYHRNCKDD